MMEQHRGYSIHGSAIPGAPTTSYSESLGIVLKSGRNGSVTEVARVQDKGITFDLQEMAEWYRLELCRVAVDECLTEP
jgi:hypothetical protein